jgi:hypothetical protein
MRTLTVVLTAQAGIGWNFAVLSDGKPLPADDPQDLESAADALRAALVQVQEAERQRKDGGR